MQATYNLQANLPWIHSVTNHLYWSAQTCNGNSDLLREKWTSSIRHIANIHHWNGELMTHCEYETVDADIDWLTVDSDAHKALKNVVLDRRLLNDMDRLTDFCHTGRLESYHAMLLKYAPKKTKFFVRWHVVTTAACSCYLSYMC